MTSSGYGYRFLPASASFSHISRLGPKGFKLFQWRRLPAGDFVVNSLGLDAREAPGTS